MPLLCIHHNYVFYILQIAINDTNVGIVVGELRDIVSVALDREDRVSANADIVSATLRNASAIVNEGGFQSTIPVSHS